MGFAHFQVTQGLVIALSRWLACQHVTDQVEDVSYGFYLWQLVFDRAVTSLTLYDRDELKFAMDAKCCTEESHPNNCWLPLSSETWIVHHVSPSVIRCMFAKDMSSGLYLPTGSEPRGVQGLLSEMLLYDSSVQSALGAIQAVQVGSGAPADLCGCVVTPPAHPGMPLQRGRLTELSTGPRLH